MALTASIYKATIHLSDMDRNLYETYNLTLAQHPSETDARMMIRILAFAIHADENLSFTKGLCADDEPELWIKSLSDQIELWIELGLPSEKRLKKACARASKVVLYAYGDRSFPIWHQKNAQQISRLANLTVFQLMDEQVSALASLIKRSMELTVTIQDGEVWISDDSNSVQIQPRQF